MSIDYNTILTNPICSFLKAKFQVNITNFEFQTTRKEFEGDITLLVFPLLNYIKINPEKLGDAIGDHLTNTNKSVISYNVLKGFLNLSLSNSFYLEQFQNIFKQDNYGHKALGKDANEVMVEFSSPNTNKPLHLGHIRNNVLGYSVSRILEANGNRVVKTQIINDRGIHICKSMVAWKKFGKGETPDNSNIKGDQLVGKYYVIFDSEYKKEIANESRNYIKNNKLISDIFEKAITSSSNPNSLPSSSFSSSLPNKPINLDECIFDVSI